MSSKRAIALSSSALTILCVAAGYYAIARVTLVELFLLEWDVVPVWPAAGWAVASVVHFKRRGLAGVMLGLTFLEWPRFGGVALLLALAGVLLEAVAGARLIDCVKKDWHAWLSQVRDLPLLGAVAAVSSTFAATLGVASMCWSGSVAWSAFVPKWLVYWLGDTLGILFVTPVLLMFLGSRMRMRPRKLAELVILALVTVGLCGVIFGRWLPAAESALAGFFPILVWASLRFGPLGASSLALLISGSALWGTARGIGPLVHGNLHHQMGLLWTFLGVVLITTFLFAAILEERRRAQEEIRERETLLSSFYDGSPVMMGIVEVRDDDLAFVSCNAALASFLGRSVESIQGRAGRELGGAEEQLKLWLDNCRESRAGNRSVRFEYQHTAANGTHSLAATVHPIAGGERQRFSLVLEDLTARARARRELDRFFALSPDMHCIVGVDGFFKRVNPALTQALGLSKRQLMSHLFIDFVHPDDRDATLAEVARLGEGARTIDFENRYRRVDGSYRWLSWMAMAEPDEELIYAAARDVTGAREAAHDLREAKERAEAATRAKSEFLANMSHELRTPLSAIIGMSELIENTALDSGQREYVDGIRQSADALLRLVDDVLDFSKIESGKIEIESTPFELEKLITSSLTPLAYQAHRKGLELVFRIAPDVPNQLLGDPTRLQQVLVNLLSNAIKFTESGHVAVEVTAAPRSAGTIELHAVVEDTGVGIPAERRQCIFESFVQADGSTTRKHGGTGLGLAICSRLVALMGGRIWVDGNVERGSRFHFTAEVETTGRGEQAQQTAQPELESMNVLVVDPAPIERKFLVSTLEALKISALGAEPGPETLSAVRRARGSGEAFDVILASYASFGDGSSAWIRALRDEQPALRFVLLTRATDRLDESYRSQLGVDGRLVKPVAPRHLRRALTILASMGRFQEKQPLSDTFTRETVRPRRILVTDDDPMNRVVTTKLLKQKGHIVVGADNGAEAVARLKNERFDLVFMDLQMPEMDGLEAAAKIRARESARGERRTPIIALTANARKEDRDRCMKAGMDGYLAKPVDPKRLIAAAERFAGRVGMPTSPRVDDASVDVVELHELIQGDDDLLGSVVEVFLDEVPAVLRDIGVSVEAGDWASVARGAHRLKGSLLTLGARSVAATAFRMEEAAHERRRSDGEREWKLLEGQVPIVMKELDSYSRRVAVERCEVTARP